MIGLYVSYVTPIFLRITSGRDKLVPGPFTLGKWFLPIGVVAVAWVSFITVLLLFPLITNPTAETMSEPTFYDGHSEILRLMSRPFTDYAVVIIMAVIIFAGLSWVISARKWFTGPVRTVEEKGIPGAYEDKKDSQVVEKEVSVNSS